MTEIHRDHYGCTCSIYPDAGLRQMSADKTMVSSAIRPPMSVCVALRRRDASSDSRCQAVRFAADWLSPSTVVISARGDIDAANATELTDYALGHMGHCHELILDLSGLEFSGTEVFWALHMIDLRCALGPVRCVVVPSAAVSRLLQICDPQTSLSTAASVGAALTGRVRG